jgi:hypothetical protein
MKRPDILDRHYENGLALIAAFDAAGAQDRIAADQWLLWASCYGSMTWQEDRLKIHVDNLAEI